MRAVGRIARFGVIVVLLCVFALLVSGLQRGVYCRDYITLRAECAPVRQCWVGGQRYYNVEGTPTLYGYRWNAIDRSCRPPDSRVRP